MFYESGFQLHHALVDLVFDLHIRRSGIGSAPFFDLRQGVTIRSIPLANPLNSAGWKEGWRKPDESVTPVLFRAPYALHPRCIVNLFA